MRHSIFFEEKELLVTDEEMPSETNIIVYHEKNDIVQAIKHLEYLSKVILYGDWNTIFADLKTLYKYIEAAGGFIKNENDEYLFIFRRGKWDLPKGKLEKGETPEIVVSKGYEITDVIDTDDTRYGFEQEGIYREEIKVKYERDGKE